MQKHSITRYSRPSEQFDFGCAYLKYLAGIFWVQGKAIADAHEAGLAEPKFKYAELPPCTKSSIIGIKS